jgi:glycosyltransferase involved in cell wall biosynthesis
MHHEPSSKSGIKAVLYKLLYAGVSHFFFLSEKTMEKTIKGGFVPRKKCSVPGWGPDMDFYSKVEKKEGDYFVSTGKENRDFNILIEAFKKTGQPLKIMTAKQHAGNDYTWLEERCKEIPNIEVILTENSGNVYPQMLSLMAGSKALVCPLQKEKLNYCVGLSTIADAEGLGKPLIITRNSYHSEARLKQFNVVETVEDWVEAISNLKHTTRNEFTMAHCWEAMRTEVIC